MYLIALRSLFLNALGPLYDKPEIESIFARIAGFVLNYSKIEIQQNLQRSIDSQHEKKMLEYLHRLSKSEPLQYILGTTEFYNQNISVDQRALIPRPETEFLVDIIVKEHSKAKSLQIIDLCTGSGCIALALAKSLSEALVTATDISECALKLALENAEKNKTSIFFIQDDLLKPLKTYQHYDVIVSNPPYVRESEREMMHSNVLNFEPYLALFVPDSDPLIFYNAIATFGLKYLSDKGKIYAEINECFGKEIQELFKSAGYIKVEVRQDIHKKDRYLIAQT